ncbi:MAG: hypothetical protein AAF998_12055 [Bacteroidota bacterium]
MNILDFVPFVYSAAANDTETTFSIAVSLPGGWKAVREDGSDYPKNSPPDVIYDPVLKDWKVNLFFREADAAAGGICVFRFDLPIEPNACLYIVCAKYMGHRMYERTGRMSVDREYRDTTFQSNAPNPHIFAWKETVDSQVRYSYQVIFPERLVRQVLDIRQEQWNPSPDANPKYMVVDLRLRAGQAGEDPPQWQGFSPRIVHQPVNPDDELIVTIEQLDNQNLRQFSARGRIRYGDAQEKPNF